MADVQPGGEGGVEIKEVIGEPEAPQDSQANDVPKEEEEEEEYRIILDEESGLDFLRAINFLPILQDLRDNWRGPLIVVMHAEEGILKQFLPQLDEAMHGEINRIEVHFPPPQVLQEEEDFLFAEGVEPILDRECRRDVGRHI